MENNQNNTKERKFFDPKWYLQQNPELNERDIALVEHFLAIGWKEGRCPSPYFDMKAYLQKHPEILPISMNPLIHMAYLASNVTKSELVFHKDALEIEKEYIPLEKKPMQRVVVFASLQYGSKIPDYEIYYLQKLKEISDAIIYISDSPILPKEFEKLAALVNYASCKRHNKYDFGSYQQGIEYIKEKIGLDQVEQLILCNNSCVAPFFEFNEFFDTMQAKKVDFWSASSNQTPVAHLQSYFLVFNHNVINSSAFIDFFANIQEEKTRLEVILKYEVRLTEKLEKAGFVCDAFVNGLKAEQSKALGFKHEDVTTYPCHLLQKKLPFVKMTFLLNPSNNFDGLENTLDLMTSCNAELATLAKKHIGKHTINKNNWFRQIPSADILQEERRKRFMQFKVEVIQAMEEEELEIRQKEAMIAAQNRIARESQTVHKYLDGLNGIEIGASSQNPFGLEKTGAYLNVDFKASHGTHWQTNKTLEPAKVHVVASGDNLPFKDESFDYVVNSHVVEHFFDPIKTIKEWFRVIKKGSYLIMIVPHKERTYDRLRPITSVQELLDRHSGKLTYESYAAIGYEKYNKDPSMQLELHDLPPDLLIQIEDGIIPDGYLSVHEREEILYSHWSVWDTEAFVEMCKAMQWNIIEVQDFDDKVGNGFLIVLQK